MSELCSFLCFKLYLVMFAFAHAQKKDRYACQSWSKLCCLKHKKTNESFEISSDINFELIKFVKNVNCLPLT